MKRLFFCCVIFVVLFCSCTNEGAEDVSTNIPPTFQVDTSSSPEASASEGYPLPKDNTENNPQGYPIVVATLDLPTEEIEVDLPTSTDVGTVTGILKWDSSLGQEPVSEQILYLGHIVYLADGQPAMGGLNKQTAPVTQSTYAGQFIFEDVPPGQYTLLLDRVVSTFLLNDPNTGGDMIIEVQGGQITDLGELVYYELPLATEE